MLVHARASFRLVENKQNPSHHKAEGPHCVSSARGHVLTLNPGADLTTVIDDYSPGATRLSHSCSAHIRHDHGRRCGKVDLTIIHMQVCGAQSHDGPDGSRKPTLHEAVSWNMLSINRYKRLPAVAMGASWRGKDHLADSNFSIE